MDDPFKWYSSESLRMQLAHAKLVQASEAVTANYHGLRVAEDRCLLSEHPLQAMEEDMHHSLTNKYYECVDDMYLLREQIFNSEAEYRKQVYIREAMRTSHEPHQQAEREFAEVYIKQQNET
jgi:hypothetical protein